MANCGLINALTDIHSEKVPNTHVRGSKQIDFALVTDGIRPCIKSVVLLDESILKSDHRAIFLDLDLLLLCGTSLDRLERPQFRNLKFDDPRISDSYRKLLHKQFESHNIYDRVQKIYERGYADDCLNEDKRCYEILDRDITAAMLRVAEKCTIRKQSKNSIQHIDDNVLDHFLEHSDVDASYFDKTMTVKECAFELRNAKAKFKDVLDEATSNGDLYEVEKEISTSHSGQRHASPRAIGMNRKRSQAARDETRYTEVFPESGISNSRACEAQLHEKFKS
jgi:hypothetical protein